MSRYRIYTDVQLNCLVVEGDRIFSNKDGLIQIFNKKLDENGEPIDGAPEELVGQFTNTFGWVKVHDEEVRPVPSGI